MPAAILVDIDGTLALRTGANPRKPFQWNRVGEDTPNAPVVEVVQRLAESGLRVVYVTGRSDECADATQRWLDKHVGVDGALHMRSKGDRRPDHVVKRELYERRIRGRHDVLCVLDDRKGVVAMWRSIGLTVFQVADGDF